MCLHNFCKRAAIRVHDKLVRSASGVFEDANTAKLLEKRISRVYLVHSEVGLAVHRHLDVLRRKGYAVESRTHLVVLRLYNRLGMPQAIRIHLAGMKRSGISCTDDMAVETMHCLALHREWTLLEQYITESWPFFGDFAYTGTFKRVHANKTLSDTQKRDIASHLLDLLSGKMPAHIEAVQRILIAEDDVGIDRVVESMESEVVYAVAVQSVRSWVRCKGLFESQGGSKMLYESIVRAAAKFGEVQYALKQFERALEGGYDSADLRVSLMKGLAVCGSAAAVESMEGLLADSVQRPQCRHPGLVLTLVKLHLQQGNPTSALRVHDAYVIRKDASDDSCLEPRVAMTFPLQHTALLSALALNTFKLEDLLMVLKYFVKSDPQEAWGLWTLVEGRVMKKRQAAKFGAEKIEKEYALCLLHIFCAALRAIGRLCVLKRNAEGRAFFKGKEVQFYTAEATNLYSTAVSHVRTFGLSAQRSVVEIYVTTLVNIGNTQEIDRFFKRNHRTLTAASLYEIQRTLQMGDLPSGATKPLHTLTEKAIVRLRANSS